MTSLELHNLVCWRRNLSLTLEAPPTLWRKCGLLN